MGVIKNTRRFKGIPKLKDYINVDINGKDTRITLEDLLALIEDEFSFTSSQSQYTELDPVLSITTNALAVQTTGNRYIASNTSGGWTVNNIYEWDGAAWVETIPVADDIVDVIANGAYQRYTGSAWVAYGGTAILQGGNTLSSPVRVGSRNTQPVYIRVNSLDIARLGNNTNTIVNPILLGGTTATLPTNGIQLEVDGNTQLDGELEVNDLSTFNEVSTFNEGVVVNTKFEVAQSDVTQLTSITTPVVITAPSGVIETVSTTLAALTSAAFDVTSSGGVISSGDKILVTYEYSGTWVTQGMPIVSVSNIMANSFTVRITNTHATNALASKLLISYLIVK